MNEIEIMEVPLALRIVFFNLYRAEEAMIEDGELALEWDN